MHANHRRRGFGEVYAWVGGIWKNKGAIIISLSHLSRVSCPTTTFNLIFIITTSIAWSLQTTLFDVFFKLIFHLS